MQSTKALADCVIGRAEDGPDEDTLIVGALHVSAAELERRSAHWAAALESHVAAVDEPRLGLLTANCADVLAVLAAADGLGVDIVPINARYVGPELVHVLDDARITHLLVGTQGVNLLERLADAVPGIPRSLESDHQDVALSSLRQIWRIRGEPAVPGSAPTSLRDAAMRHQDSLSRLVLYTSGTTSRPKGCLIRMNDLVTRARSLADERFRMTAADRTLVPLPMFHVAALLPIVASLISGGVAITLPHFEGDATIDLMERERATIMFAGFPAIANAVIEHPRFSNHELGHLRLIHSSGTPNQLRRLQDAFPSATQTSPYGCTEGIGLIAVSSLDDDPEARATSAGRPFAGLRVEIVDPADGTQPLPVGAVGEIIVSGEPMFAGYLGDPVPAGRTAFRTGDLGCLDAEGRVSFRGRLKDMLKVGGENVACVEIEEVLNSHPGVVSAQVVGVPDSRLEEVPVAFVELRYAVSPDELREFCARRLARFKIPRSIHRIEAWPMSATKVDKAALRRRLSDMGSESPEAADRNNGAR